MKGKKESAKKKGQEAAKVTRKPPQGELSEQDLDKVAAGSGKRQWKPVQS